MNKLLIEHMIQLPQGGQENSCFKPVNEAGAKLFHFVEENLSDEIKMTAAYHAFERSWVEFVNNSHDAGATHIWVRVFEHDSSIKIQILDDGRGLTPGKETEHYDWKKALLTVSDKAAEAKASGKKSCGQHLALSTTAYALERQKGSLGISNRLNKQGALVTIVSPITPCNSDIFLEAAIGEGKNILEEMFHIISKDDSNGIEQVGRISSSPDIGRSRKEAARSVLTRIQTPINENSFSTIETPTLVTPLAASPQFLLRRKSTPNTSFFSPSNTHHNQSPSPDDGVVNSKSSTRSAAAF